MATLQELINALASLGIEMIAGLLALLTVLLIVLISLAYRGRKTRTAEVEPTPQQHADVSSSRVEAPSRSQVQVRDNEPAAKPEIKPEPQIATAEKSPVVAEKVELKQESAVPVSELSPEPEDSVLHRHYLANEAAKDAALHEPYPSDSVLRRHYDTAHKIEVDTPPMAAAPVEPAASAASVASEDVSSEIPEDSVLHRHFLANEEAKETALHEPYPSDSVLRRHYDVAHKIVVDASPTPTTLETISAAAPSSKVGIPEDSVLKRHFIAQLTAEVEAGLPPRPADSVLQRHYDSLLSFELEKRLAG